MKKLDRAKFVDDTVASGNVTDVEIAWRSSTSTVLHLNYDHDQFRVVPESLELAAAPTGANERRAVRITHLGTAQHCDVHFVLGDNVDDAIDSIEVT